ncbi:transposase [Siculibacillus lacustris]|uniref:Transposase n=1 Tax=Siculibacillus lacustris TaxID=1549641 RepID=A0A4Q9VDV9_9HYPH|nr:DDE-type integrase/transposase/recombinase [Siculibacillus lacustris]TBW32919.1 transposase [Siculibacillus lacustris]
MNALIPYSYNFVEEKIEPVRFDLKQHDRVKFNGQVHVVMCRYEKKVAFIAIDTGVPVDLTDQEIARLWWKGDLAFINTGVRDEPLEGVTRVLTTSDTHKKSFHRKLYYINAAIYGTPVSDAGVRPGYVLTRTAKGVKPIIDAAHAALRDGSSAPAASTVLKWLYAYEHTEQAFVAEKLIDKRGFNPGRAVAFHPLVRTEIQNAVSVWMRSNISKDRAYASLWTRLDDAKKAILAENPQADVTNLNAPHAKTFATYCKAVNRFARDSFRVGRRWAELRYRTYQQTIRPSRVLQEVEIDHGLLDIIVIGYGGIYLGRPYLTSVIDRASGMIIGRYLGFEAASTASVVAALLDAMSPKDLTRFKALGEAYQWPCYGTPECLIVDNGREFVGPSLQMSCEALGISLITMPPAYPHMKGGVERAFKTFNDDILHSLPGTTYSNSIERKLYESGNPARPNLPAVTLEELDGLLLHWIVAVHSRRPTEALGSVPGTARTRISVWNEKVKAYPIAPPPPADQIMAFLGEVEKRTIQNIGIQWSHIHYDGPGLAALRSHADHRLGGEKGGGTEYVCVRNPLDLGSIYVVNPHRQHGGVGERIEVVASPRYREYATGLHRHVHNVTVTRARELYGNEPDVEALMRVKSGLIKTGIAFVKERGVKKTHKHVARFLEGCGYTRMESSISTSNAPFQKDPIAEAGYRMPSSVVEITRADPNAMSEPRVEPDKPLGRKGGPKVSSKASKFTAAVPRDAVDAERQQAPSLSNDRGPDRVDPDARRQKMEERKRALSAEASRTLSTINQEES